jgi:hypothetical protein
LAMPTVDFRPVVGFKQGRNLETSHGILKSTPGTERAALESSRTLKASPEDPKIQKIQKILSGRSKIQNRSLHGGIGGLSLSQNHTN